MMTAAAHLEVVSDPTQSLDEVDRDIADLISIQQEVARLEKMAREVRGRIRAFMVSNGLRGFSSRGRKAVLFDVTRFEFNRALAERVLDAETLGTLLTASTTTQLRVK